MDWWRLLKPVVDQYWTEDMPEHVQRDPFKTLIGCILSQRTRDETTDAAFRRLFSRYSGPEDLARADPADVEELIYPVGFYRNKAKTIVKAARYILSEFGGRVPDRFEDLIKIPGIGRKCANIVLAYAFGKPAIPVDTHVYRVAKRLGIVLENAKPEDVEEALKRIVPRSEWIKVNHALVRFGRAVCRPVGPKCDECPFKDVCRYYRTHVSAKG
ncbi:MAG: endonuclease [Candidatus Diapherotrites archaeon]|nr:endonuclease [Candidatus Diapherotrites archaeon]MDN5366914.1 endonuclease [Candidatus Diapherotrites archaeon]